MQPDYPTNRDPVSLPELAAQIRQIVHGRLDAALPARLPEFEERFARDGDMAYGALSTELFAPVRSLLRDYGLKAMPRLPGSFQESREWGNEDETHQQRWFWSIIRSAAGTSLGSIAVGLHHDHSRFRFPEPPAILALEGRTNAQVVKELSGRLPEFSRAQAFRDWYREWLINQPEEGC